jgi:hypothetical protein
MMSAKIKSSLALVLLGGLALRLAQAFFNPGFFAFDDYQSLLRLVVPAQDMSVAFILENAEIRSPLPRFLLWALAKLGFELGLSDPLSQVRWIYALLGASSMLIPIAAYCLFRNRNRDDWAWSALVFLSLNAVLGFFSTRVLFESLAMLPLFLAFYSFENSKSRRSTFLGLLMLASACVVRPQCGLLVLIPLIDVLRSGNRQRIASFMISGLSIALAIGLSDWWLRGEIFQSLKMYVHYNAAHSSEYGSKPFWFYLPLTLVLAPFFSFLMLPKKDYLEALKSNSRAWIWVGIFVLAHSLVPHKEERFLIPILPIFWLALSPLVAALIARRSFFRLGSLAFFQLLVLAATLLSPTQWNIIGATRFLGSTQNLARVLHFGGALDVFPRAYSQSQLPAAEAYQKGEVLTCQDRVVCRSTNLEELSALAQGQLKVEAAFEPGLVENFFIKLNPKKNGRRARLLVLKSSACP